MENKVIVPVIMSGGSGTRLWPMSREFYPKQFHHMLDNHTMLQHTVLRLEGVCEPEQLIVIGNREHRFMITEQLAEIGWQDANVLLEPVGRNTAPAVAMAALAALEISEQATLLVLAADHVIKDSRPGTTSKNWKNGNPRSCAAAKKRGPPGKNISTISRLLTKKPLHPVQRCPLIMR